MKIHISSEEDYRREKSTKRCHFVFGILIGCIIFGCIGLLQFLRFGSEELRLITWVSLGFGIVSFGFLAYIFGNSFWSLFKPK